MVAYRKARQVEFSTVCAESAFLPLDLLWRIAHRDTQVAGLTPNDYDLTIDPLNEAISTSWGRVLKIWHSFNEARSYLPASESGMTLTRQRWLLPLFDELRYGRLSAAQPIRLWDKSYPISYGFHNVPIHFVSYKDDLDHAQRRTVHGTRYSPHSLVQELLNRSTTHLWGIVSNGLHLRILRRHVSLTRQEYVEFDLEAMMNGEVYADFILFWLLCHPSRLRSQQRPDDCWLEIWSREAQKQGERALDQLRDNIEFAITELGRGFLDSTSNTHLLHKLRTGQLSAQDYYKQVLRLVYRLLVLLVAEDRDVLFDPAADEICRKRYMQHYSLSRLRKRSEEVFVGKRYSDLYYPLRLVMRKLGEEQGCPELGLPPLNGYLFSREALPDLENCQLSNYALLTAVRALAYRSTGRARRPVDYRHLGAEEFGSVYEALLELHPVIDVERKSFSLESGGKERKTTGAYYTPPALVACLLDSALEPLLDEACAQPDPQAALLKLKICDPACGSGHFLVAAAHRIAARLVNISTDGEALTSQFYRRMLREVISKCLYGVDSNPMAVELCRLNLALEGLEPGKPLAFLDAHIQCGNSLLGTPPALLAQGIPDSAYEPLGDDSKQVCNTGRRLNRAARPGQRSLWPALASSAEDLQQATRDIAEISDGTFAEAHRKADAYYALLHSEQHQWNTLLADAWCAAFVCDKRNVEALITQDTLRQIEENPRDFDAVMKVRIHQLAQQYQFFHWHLAFPDVFTVPQDKAPDNEHTGWSGGFDAILGNPPWERIKIQEKEWFAAHNPAIANATNAAQRRKLIATLAEQNPVLYAAFREDQRKAEGESHLLRHSGRYPLCGRGDVNTYSVFAENIRHLIHPRGRIGYIVPSGIATDDTTKFFFQDLMEKRALVNLYDFENRDAIFQSVHRSYKFSLLTMSGPALSSTEGTTCAFFAHQVFELQDEQRRFTLSASDIELLNPNTRTCPIFRSKRDMYITKSIYERVPVLIKEGSPEVNPWGITFATMFHMANDSHHFRTYEQLRQEGWQLVGNVFYREQDRCLPLYEGKMIAHFDHRYSSYTPDAQDTRELNSAEHADPDAFPLPRYWVNQRDFAERAPAENKALLVFRDITNATNERTAIFSIVPAIPCTHTLPIMLTNVPDKSALLYFSSCSASFAFDYGARQKLGGTHLTFFILKQLPVLPPERFKAPCPWGRAQSVGEWILPRALELTYTAWDLEAFAKDCGYAGPPFRWDEARRFLLRCELDAAYFHLYGIAREDVDYIMDTFRVFREKEVKQYGEYRTKRVILELYDAMQQVTERGTAYQTQRGTLAQG